MIQDILIGIMLVIAVIAGVCSWKMDHGKGSGKVENKKKVAGN